MLNVHSGAARSQSVIGHEAAASGSHITVVRGLPSVLRLSALLEASASLAGQAGTMHWLDCFLNHQRTSRWRRPCLVLVAAEGADLQHLKPAQVRGAVLFTEYCLLHWSSGVFVTPDLSGLRNMFSVDGEQTKIAVLAMTELLRKGAQLTIASFESIIPTQEDHSPKIEMPGLVWARRSRLQPKYLELKETFDATLATLGKSTRFNMRYYRRRLAKRLSCEYVPNARGLLTEDQLASLNKDSLNPLSFDEFRLRWKEASNHPDGFLCGLRTEGGEWLSFIGGWRNGTTTVLHWQLNRAGYESESLSQVMRSYFIEAEILRGARRLMIDGGTHTSIIHSFKSVPVWDLVIKRASNFDLRQQLTRLIFVASQALLKRKYFVLEILADKQMHWSSTR